MSHLELQGLVAAQNAEATPEQIQQTHLGRRPVGGGSTRSESEKTVGKPLIGWRLGDRASDFHPETSHSPAYAARRAPHAFARLGQ